MTRRAPILFGSTPTRHAFPGIPGYWSPTMQHKAAEDLALVASVYPKLDQIEADIDEFGDVEDFWEDLARASAAIRAAQTLGTDFTDCSRQSVTNTWTHEQMLCRLGPVLSAEERSHNPDLLINHPIVTRHGGRFMSLAGYTDQPGEFSADEDVIQIALARARTGVDRVVIKLSDSKKGIFALDLHESITAEQVHDELLSDESLGWTFIRLAGQRNTLLVQDWIPMTHEYRLFVVDGEIITSAACIEESTPYNRTSTDQLTDTRVRRHRGNSVSGRAQSDIVDDLELVDAMLAFGAGIAADFAGTAVIDVAMNADTEDFLVVELNTLPNAGLYASNVDALYLALANADDRGYNHYAFTD